MTHTFMVSASLTLSFTFRSEDVDGLGSDAPTLRSEAASALAAELAELVGRDYAVHSVLIDQEDAVLIGVKTEQLTAKSLH